MDSESVSTPTSSKVDSTSPTDALQAVQQDPAVLKAQISADQRTTPSPVPVPENKSFAHQKLVDEVESRRNGAEGSLRFEDSVRLQKAAVLSLAPQQLDLLLQYAGALRLQRHINQDQASHPECAFCKKNGERSLWYSSHTLKDSRGRVRCPVLRGYRCPACGATGDRAHTIKYCPMNRYGDRWSR